MKIIILIAAIIAMTLVAVWVAGASVKSNDCWVLPQYVTEAQDQDQVVVRCVVEKPSEEEIHGHAR